MKNSISLILALALVSACGNEAHTLFDRRGLRVITTTSVPAKTDVRVEFSGLMCHVFHHDANNKLTKARVVVLEDALHPVRLRVPSSVNMGELEAATGCSRTPAQGQCEIITSGNDTFVDGLDGVVLRVVGYDPATKTIVSGMTPALTKQPAGGTSFDKNVPHLREVTRRMLDVEKTATLAALANNEKKYAAFFELEGGELTAPNPYCNPARFDPDFEAKGPRDFAEDVYLDGEVPKALALEFIRDGVKKPPVTFNTAFTAVTIQLSAESTGSAVGKSHFRHFARLNGTPGAQWTDVIAEKCDDSGALPGCSNNQWP